MIQISSYRFDFTLPTRIDVISKIIIWSLTTDDSSSINTIIIA